jgi:SnoaL-like domain
MDDRFDVVNRVAALGLYVDQLRWNDLLALFTSKVVVDYTSLFGGEARQMTREDLITDWQAFVPGFTRTQHLIGAVHVTFTERFAYAEAPVLASHVVKDPALAGNETWLVGGRYEMQIEKHSGEWCVRALNLAGAWAEGNLDLPRIATQRVQEGHGRDTSF